jgi:hypothetical protein
VLEEYPVLGEYPQLHVRIEADRRSPGTDPEPDYQAQVDGVWGWELVRPIVTKDPPPESLPSDSGQDIEDTVARRLDTFIENSDPQRSIEESVFEIHDQLPVYASAMIGDRVMRTEPVDSLERKVVFVLTRQECDAALGSLRFNVVGEDREVPEALFCLLRRASEDMSGTPLRPPTSGEFHLRRLLPGPLGLEIGAPGCATTRLEIRVEPGVDRDLGEIRLESGASIRGRILGPDDSLWSFEFARLTCVSLSGTEDPAMFGSKEYGTTGTEGRFTITGLRRGRYVLRTLEGLPFRFASGPIEVSTESGSVEGVELRLKQTTQVSLKLNDPPAGTCTILVEDSGHLPADEGRVSRDGYVVLDLPIGWYSARAVVAGKVIATADFEASLPRTRVILGPR